MFTKQIYSARLLSAFIEANEASGGSLRDTFEYALLPAVQRGLRLSRAAFGALLRHVHRQLGDDGDDGDESRPDVADKAIVSALLVWRLYLMQWPALQGDSLRCSVAQCVPSSRAAERLLKISLADEWRWSAADANDVAARDNLVAELSSLYPKLAKSLRTRATKHWSTKKARTDDDNDSLVNSIFEKLNEFW